MASSRGLTCIARARLHSTLANVAGGNGRACLVIAILSLQQDYIDSDTLREQTGPRAGRGASALPFEAGARATPEEEAVSRLMTPLPSRPQKLEVRDPLHTGPESLRGSDQAVECLRMVSRISTSDNV